MARDGDAFTYTLKCPFIMWLFVMRWLNIAEEQATSWLFDGVVAALLMTQSQVDDVVRPTLLLPIYAYRWLSERLVYA